VAARLLGLRVRILPGHGCPSLVSVVCCQVEVSVMSRSLVQGVLSSVVCLECYREASIRRLPWPSTGCCALKKDQVFALTVPVCVNDNSISRFQKHFIREFCPDWDGG